MCLLFAKSGVELLLLTVRGQNQFWRWESWMLLFALCVFALLQLWYLHKGLVLADPTLVCPCECLQSKFDIYCRLTIYPPAAFCFYNLSSIVNGLVYFDQFALISPLHLVLVAVGIIVLLVGVWVVSIQAGGGGVDVDRWKEGGESLSDDEDTLSVGSDNEPRDFEEGNQGQSLLVQGHEQQPFRMERHTVSESQIHTPRRQSFQVVHRTVDDTLPATSPRSASVRQGTTSDALLSPSSTRTRRRRRSTLQPTDTQPTSLPLGGSSVLGSGLSIGLGPMSPGFSIVPRDRRRRIGGIGFADVVEDVGGQRRRTVSEGDMRRLAEGGGDEEAVEINENEQENSSEPFVVKSGTKANMRWEWARRMFLDRR
jgi:hypothetical protein